MLSLILEKKKVMKNNIYFLNLFMFHWENYINHNNKTKGKDRKISGSVSKSANSKNSFKFPKLKIFLLNFPKASVWTSLLYPLC